MSKGLVVTAAFLFLGSPFITEASFFDTLKAVFGATTEKSVHNETSQTTTLLDPTIAPEPRVKGLVVDESSLATIPEGTDGKQVPLISTYTVRPGDTLSIIAEMFDVSVNTILWSNGLSKNGVIRVGQELIILPASGISYTIKKGDTITSIAKKYDSDAAEIRDFNALKDGEPLAVGTTIIIPDAEPLVQALPTPKAPVSNKGLPGLIVGGYTKDPAGYFIRPIDGGRRTQGIHGFNGVDLASTFGSPIKAAAAGSVMIAKSGGWNGGYGSYVVIKHANGMQTLYGHLSQVLVSPGQTVVQGQTIGKMGNTGKSTGVHLHFEVRGGKNPF